MSDTTKLNDALCSLGLTARTFRSEDDLQANVDLTNVCNRADEDEWVDTIEQARNWLSNYDLTKGDPRADMVMVETADGQLVANGSMHWLKTDEGEWHYSMSGKVHPDWRRKGLGSAVLRWTEARARDVAAGHDHNGAPVLFAALTADHTPGEAALFTWAGYAPVRFWHSMLRDLSAPIPDWPLPEGVEVRPVQREHVRQVLSAFDEAFRDHWGHREMTESDVQHFINWPDFNPDIWVIAWQDDEVIGGCQNDISPGENEALGLKRGWLSQIAIRRPWRGQGIAKATMAQSMRLLKNLGMAEAGLGVDTQNPSGALQLYEGMGFRVHRRFTSYRKPLK